MSFSVEDLLLQAKKALDAYEPLLACKFLERAFEIEQRHDIASQIGDCYLESLNMENVEDPVGNTEKAKQWFLKSIELETDLGHSKYLNLGQLSLGKEALHFYERGLMVLVHELEMMEDEERVPFRAVYSKALCAMTEIYMTDCCDEPEAESKCVEYMTEALKQDPHNPEVYQTFASVRISQCMPDEAKALLQQSMDMWYQPDSDKNWPIYTARLSLARLLMEVGDNERAQAVLQTCLSEDDEDAEGWYLFGWSYYQSMQQAQDPEEYDLLKQDARECLEHLFKLDEKLKKTMNDQVDPTLLEHARQLINELD
ncbi:hypothetical protein EDD86DRAFT_204715 [Gorgonomyces haynaldii]|nr:hypothetical protein EDD86DRAFT_204715 [Gorgonomyces haynaldii]